MRLKGSQIKEFRENLLREQGYVCALCGEVLSQKEAVLDHCHDTGKVRGAIHGNCNIALGKLENAVKFRAKMDKWQFSMFARGLWMYLMKDQSHMPYHPKHLSKQCSQFRSLKADEQIEQLEMMAMADGAAIAIDDLGNQKKRVALFRRIITNGSESSQQ